MCLSSSRTWSLPGRAPPLNSLTVFLSAGVPDEAGRCEILAVQLRRLQSAAVRVAVDSTTLRHCASVTHGFVGADLQLVCTEALLGAMRQGVTGEGDGTSTGTSTGTGAAAEDEGEGKGGHGVASGGGGGGGVGRRAAVVVGNVDLVGAIGRVSPSALREVAVEVPKVRWGDVGGQAEVKQAMKELVEWPLSRPEAFRRLGIKPPNGLLLYGPPGCSKVRPFRRYCRCRRSRGTSPARADAEATSTPTTPTTTTTAANANAANANANAATPQTANRRHTTLSLPDPDGARPGHRNQYELLGGARARAAV